METYQLKNIAIVILLLLNGCLLLLLGYQFLQEKRTELETAEQLTALYEANQVELDSRLEIAQQPLSVIALSRSSGEEQAIASYLLDGDAQPASQGGGIYSYETERGAIQFRSGGSFDGGSLRIPVEDAAQFSDQFCTQFGYEDLQMQDAAATAVQQAGGVPIYGCELTMRFADGALESVTGVHVSLADAAVESVRSMTCATALTRFLDYRAASGVVCSAVTDVQCVYVLQSTSAVLRLLPVWQIETDTYTYFVDCTTGEVSRR